MLLHGLRQRKKSLRADQEKGKITRRVALFEAKIVSGLEPAEKAKDT